MKAMNLLLTTGLALFSVAATVHAQKSARPAVNPFRIGIEGGIASHTGSGPLAIWYLRFPDAKGLGPRLILAADYRLGGASSPWRLEMSLGYNSMAVGGSYDSREMIEVPVGGSGDTVERVPIDFKNVQTLYTTELTINPSIRYDIGEILYAGVGMNVGVRIRESKTQVKQTLLTRVVDIPDRGVTEVSFADDKYTKTFPATPYEDAPTLALGATIYLGAEFDLGSGFAIGPRVGGIFGITPYVKEPAFRINTLWGAATLRYQL
jgi:hypothetical protein